MLTYAAAGWLGCASSQEPPPVASEPDAAVVMRADARASGKTDLASMAAMDPSVDAAASPLDATAAPTLPEAGRPDGAVSADASGANDARAIDATAAAPRLDAAVPVPASCTYQSCGGDPRGNWVLAGYCQRNQANLIRATGTYVVADDGTYKFLLTSLLPAMKEPVPPQTGSWRVEGKRLILTPVEPAPYWPHSGALVIGRSKSEPISFCAGADVLKVNASDNPQKDFWLFTRAR